MGEGTRARLDAVIRLLIVEGHLTPMGKRLLAKVLDEEGIT